MAKREEKLAMKTMKSEKKTAAVAESKTPKTSHRQFGRVPQTHEEYQAQAMIKVDKMSKQIKKEAKNKRDKAEQKKLKNVMSSQKSRIQQSKLDQQSKQL